LNQKINKDTKLCISLAARPSNIGTRFHNFLYQELELNFIYKAFTTANLADAVAGIRGLGIRGCGVSMPYKEVCIPYIDELDQSAQALQSVNTIVNDDGYLRAYNTDYIAVAKLLKSHNISNKLTFSLRGSGGMAKAVARALFDAGFKQGWIVSRNETTGRKLAESYGYQWQNEEANISSEMLINVTPIGMTDSSAADQLAFSREAVSNALVIFDVVALPAETPLINLANKLNKVVISGAEVISLQAAEQFYLYTGIFPSEQQVQRASEYARSGC